MKRLATIALVSVAIGCGARDVGDATAEPSDDPRVPDVEPVMINDAFPFTYPPTLWAQRVQGNVLLHLFVDTAGVPVADSTRIATSSGIPALDSAALRGAPQLRFSPARRDAMPLAVAVLFPVLFRHPDAPPLPGDSALTTHVRRPDFP
jgi:TonB family protein